jgi:hypothetical protein
MAILRDVHDFVQGVIDARKDPNIFRTSTQRVESKLIIVYSFVQYNWGAKGNKEYSQSPALAVVKKSSVVDIRQVNRSQ